MSICRQHPKALNDGECMDCLREENFELRDGLRVIESGAYKNGEYLSREMMRSIASNTLYAKVDKATKPAPHQPEAPCPQCDGEGEVKTGYDSATDSDETEECPYCHGTGHYEAQVNGSRVIGYEPCTHCGGKPEAPKAWECRGHDNQQTGGYYKYQRGTCPECKPKGDKDV